MQDSKQLPDLSSIKKSGKGRIFALLSACLLGFSGCLGIHLQTDSALHRRLLQRSGSLCKSTASVRILAPVVVLDLEPTFGLPTVQGTVGPRKLRFLVDTGSQFCLLRAGVVEELGLPVGKQMLLSLLGKESPALTTCVHSMELGAIKVQHFPFVVSPGYLEERFLWITVKKIDGVLGMPFLRNFVVTVDMPKQKVLLQDPRYYNPPDSSSYGAIPLAYLSDGRLCTSAKINGKGRYILLLDTAARRCVLRDRVARQLGLEPSGTVRLVSLGVSEKASLTRISSIQLGPFCFKNLSGYILKPDQARMLKYTDGLLGINLFEKLSFTIDPFRKLLLIPFPKT